MHVRLAGPTRAGLGLNRGDDPQHDDVHRDPGHHQADCDPYTATDAAGATVDSQCDQRTHGIQGNVGWRNRPGIPFGLLHGGAGCRCCDDVALTPQAAIRAIRRHAAGGTMGKVHA